MDATGSFPGGGRGGHMATCAEGMALDRQVTGHDHTTAVNPASNGIIPGATVTATHIDTGTSFTAVSDATGTYRVPTLRVGTYRVTAELTGFTTASRDNLQVLIGQNVVLNFRIALSTVQETVTVTATAASKIAWH